MGCRLQRQEHSDHRTNCGGVHRKFQFHCNSDFCSLAANPYCMHVTAFPPECRASLPLRFYERITDHPITLPKGLSRRNRTSGIPLAMPPTFRQAAA
jgi:hypothetical protein